MAVDIYCYWKRSEMTRRVFDMKIECRRLASESLRAYACFVYAGKKFFFECLVTRVWITASYFAQKSFFGKKSASFKVRTYPYTNNNGRARVSPAFFTVSTTKSITPFSPADGLIILRALMFSAPPPLGINVISSLSPLTVSI